MVHVTNPLAQQVRRYLDDGGVHYVHDDDPCRFQFVLSIPCALERIWVIIIAEDGFLTVIASPLLTPDPHDTEAIRNVETMFTRINCHLRAGSFSIDVRNGKTNYRIGAPYMDVPSFRTLDVLMALVCLSWERHGDEYLRLAFPGGLPFDDEDDGDDDEDDGDDDEDGGRDLVAEFDALFGEGGGDGDADDDDDMDACDDTDTSGASDGDLTDRERSLLESADDANRRGIDCERRGELRQALDHYQDALRAYLPLEGRIPEYHLADVHFEIADMQLRLSNIDEAKRGFLRFLDARRRIRTAYHPNQPFADYKTVAAHAALADIYRAAGDEERANRETAERERARANMSLESTLASRVNGYCY
ncbi:tetratricopeptide repeat protein [Bifidobacterium saguinibicoloris]|uniref:tetratricopeptide repeat protein n=1 Tax=Bifidobacterium saguinibicoloris TaxID=2834433 RepID=UPI001C594398|nr:hypothetical protein [Bifidobacterium saguinibicoloris]MBW3080215.1 hypothetical protein [Bifidobacterium saguinibicoloris]